MKHEQQEVVGEKSEARRGRSFQGVREGSRKVKANVGQTWKA